MPYFDPRPKVRIEDLYDRESELNELLEAMKRGDPLILILGLRRTGKTSLLYVSLNTIGYPHIIIDCRSFEDKTYISYSDFVHILEESVNKCVSRFTSLLKFLKSIRGVSIRGLRVEFSWSSKDRLSLVELFEALNEYAIKHGTRFILAFDEAQELIRLRGVRLLPTLSYAYDRLKGLTIILTGSQVGLLYKFLKVDDPASPLYGRIRTEIRLGNLSKEKSIGFLIEGFKQHGIILSRDVVERVISKLDGNIGWLTYYGALAVRKGLSEEVLEYVLKEGSKLALREFINFLRLRMLAAKRYITIMYCIAQEPKSWSQVKAYLESREGKRISDSILTALLRNLMDAGFILKCGDKYEVSDPLLKYGILREGKKLISKLGI